MSKKQNNNKSRSSRNKKKKVTEKLKDTVEKLLDPVPPKKKTLKETLEQNKETKNTEGPSKEKGTQAKEGSNQSSPGDKSNAADYLASVSLSHLAAIAKIDENQIFNLPSDSFHPYKDWSERLWKALYHTHIMMYGGSWKEAHGSASMFFERHGDDLKEEDARLKTLAIENLISLAYS